MLLSFERPAKPVISRRPSGPVGSPAPPTLFADLENYTVANVIGYLGESFTALAWRNLMISPMVFPSGNTTITVKIVRAHGGCLGTKSR